MLHSLLALAFCCTAVPADGGETPHPAPRIDFQRDVRPILAGHCFACHGPSKQKGGLRLDRKRPALQGGDSGPVIVPGRAEESLVLRLVAGLDDDRIMPPGGKRLDAWQLATLRGWIDQGADWPAGTESGEDPRDWWSLRPLVRPAVPVLALDDRAGARNPIDAFIRSKLREKGLPYAHEADRRTLARRLHFDLIGLPPTAGELNAFVRDAAPDAYEKLVDRLLSSPHHGERWARHWLDVVHYGDTHGYDKDQPRPWAWPYRDYVIRAFNADMPFGRFARQQIAGDVLEPGTADGVMAMGFIAAGPWDLIGHAEVPETKLDGQVARHLDRDDMVTTTINTFLSLTIQCAQCHNHKFDPIPQEEYYRLQAVFAALDRADRPYPGRPGSAPAGMVYAGTVHNGGKAAFRGTGPDGGKPRRIFVLRRGDIKSPIKEVGPAALGLLPELPGTFALAAQHTEGDRRAALARWLTDARNALFWRSIVNRVWQYHFGRGIAATPNDFGRMGQLPTHPELLDWLAVEFRDGGQSLKALHRLIVTSAAYRQVSDGNPAAAASDADNAYLWRMNRRKLEAEAIRDAALSVAGKLDTTMYGPAFRDFVVEHPEHSPHYEYERNDPADPSTFRRAVYRFLVRSRPQPFMAALDCADPSMQVDRRNETGSPLQALALYNNGFMLTMARYLADRVAGRGSAQDQVAAAFQVALGRTPTAKERDLLADHAVRFGLPGACRVIFNMNEFLFVD